MLVYKDFLGKGTIFRRGRMVLFLEHFFTYEKVPLILPGMGWYAIGELIVPECIGGVPGNMSRRRGAWRVFKGTRNNECIFGVSFVPAYKGKASVRVGQERFGEYIVNPYAAFPAPR